jgi:ankyrin repeat protein
MQLLLAHGADPSITLKNGSTVLMVAAGLGWRDGVPPNPTMDRSAEDPLALEALALSLSLNGDINAANADGDTALHAAAAGRGLGLLIQFLVDNGADLNARNKAGRTPLEAAAAVRDREGFQLRPDAIALLTRIAAERRAASAGRAQESP